MKTSFLLIVLLNLMLFTSCGSKLVKDPSVSVVEANYPSLEIHSPSKLNNGLAIVNFKEGQNLKDLKISVRGYFKGELRLFSDHCQIDENIRYDDSRLIPLNFDVELFRSCLITAVLTVDYSKYQGTVKTYPLKGFIALVPEKKYEAGLHTRKIMEDKTSIFNLKTNSDSEYRIVIRGCGISEDFFRQPVNGNISIDLGEILGSGIRTCYLDMAVLSDSEKLRHRFLLSIFSTQFTRLPKPKIDWKRKSKLKLTANNNVSVISVGNKYEVKRKATFKYNKNDTVRLITVKGRLLLGTIQDKGRILWKQ